MDVLLDEVKPAHCQFGGFKGSGTVHLLAELITESMEALDDNRSASTLISVDLSKAFNRMRHSQCLDQLARKGASSQSIRMAASFLSGRSMRIKLPGGVFSAPRLTPGGSPQGTKSGNFFFCVASEGLSQIHPTLDHPLPPPEGPDCPPFSPTSSDSTEDSNPSSPLGGVRYDRRMSAKKLLLQSSDSEDEPLPVDRMAAQHMNPPRWIDKDLLEANFIDDMTGHEKCGLDFGFSGISTKKETRLLWARKLECFLNAVKENCKLRGMQVNEDKTQILCISTAINYDIRSFIRMGDGQRTSADTLKIVGYTFGRRPGPAEHLKQLRRSYGARAWTIRHLKKMNLPADLLVRIYCSLIRPIFDYASPAYHTTLTDQQSESLERLQRATLKTIYGLNTSYATASRCPVSPL